MNRDTVYRKTALGLEAIAKRHPSLAARDRSLLIMIDGRRGSNELAALGRLDEVLPALLAHGFIEPVPGTAPQVAAPEAPAAPATEEGEDAPLPFPVAQKLAVRRLNDLLGPAATDLCMRVEQARTPQEFLAVLRKIEATLKQALGPQASSRLLREIGRIHTT